MLDGQGQSAVDLDDPARLDFEYVQHLALCVDALAPAGPLRVTHVGGAGLTLPRWVHHTRPGSPQIVLEPDAALTEAVRRELPLPRGHRIRVRALDGISRRARPPGRQRRRRRRRRLRGGAGPAELGTLEWFAEVARVLAAGWAAPRQRRRRAGYAVCRRASQPAPAQALGHVAFVALHEVLKGKRFGNLVLVASRGPLDVWTLRRATASAPLPTGVLAGDQLQRRTAGARPFRAARRRHGILTGAAPPGRVAPPVTPVAPVTRHEEQLVPNGSQHGWVGQPRSYAVAW